MKDLLVLMLMTTPKHLFGSYTRRLREADIDFHVEKVESFPNENSGGTFGYKISSLRRLSWQFRDYEKLVFTCAWDMMFFGTKKEVLRKIPEHGILIAAERNCYPDTSIADMIPGNTPWRFANGGCMAGRPLQINDWTYEIERHAEYTSGDPDQKILNILVSHASYLAPLDSKTELFYCMAGEIGELDFENGLPVNTLCGTHPNFLHFNGRWPIDDTMAKLERSLR